MVTSLLAFRESNSAVFEPLAGTSFSVWYVDRKHYPDNLDFQVTDAPSGVMSIRYDQIEFAFTDLASDTPIVLVMKSGAYVRIEFPKTDQGSTDFTTLAGLIDANWSKNASL